MRRAPAGRMGELPETVDVAIIGSGIGGSTIAYGLAGSGARIAVLERGFQRGVFRPVETWLDARGRRFNPGNYYYVGGNSKFYGAVLIRYRERDFAALEHWDGVSPAWPFGYEVLEPWYCRAEQLFEVRGAAGQDPTEP